MHEERKALLKEIFTSLKEGKDIASAKQQFQEGINELDPTELPILSEMLGMPQKEVRRLCDTHLGAMNGSLDRKEVQEAHPGSLPLNVGYLTPEMVNLVLTLLPFDLAVLDERDCLVWYSPKEKRMLPRSPQDIGVKMWRCHPPRSIRTKNKRLLEGFHNGVDKIPEFWFERDGRFIYIRYFPIRDAQGNYKGCLEVAQDVKRIKTVVEGEHRSLD